MLILASVINASAFTIGSIIGTTYLAVPLLAIGLFMISYFGVYPNTATIVVISAVVFSFGVALPGINNIPPGERFWLFLVGGLWGLLGAITVIGWQLLKKNPAIEVVKPPVQAHLRSNPGVLDPLKNNMSLQSGHFQFAVSFAVIGAIGLLIAQGLGLVREVSNRLQSKHYEIQQRSGCVHLKGSQDHTIPILLKRPEAHLRVYLVLPA
jgi:hypothetical protein